MPRICLPLFALLLLLFAWTVSADEGEIGGIDWMTDLDAARAQAKEEGRPLLVVFR